MQNQIRPGMSSQACIDAISGGDREAGAVLLECNMECGGNAFEIFLTILDSKRLYGSRICELYELCGKDVKRFIYHVKTELPNQETGKWGVTGEYAMQFLRRPELRAARQFGRPNSFWALEHPPTKADYEYPII